MSKERNQTGREALENALKLKEQGVDPKIIELPESAVFPHLVPCCPQTARKSRITGTLLGRPAPRHFKRGRSVRYKLADLLAWLADEGEGS